MRMPVKLPRGLYWKVVPLILAGASVLLFLIASFLLETWGQGWQALLLLFSLSLETFFLPYALAPLALRLPTFLPWVHYKPKDQFSIDGADRLVQRIILGTLIVMAGLPVLTAHDTSAPAWVPAALHIPAILILAARTPAAFFAVILMVLAIPDFGRTEAES